MQVCKCALFGLKLGFESLALLKGPQIVGLVVGHLFDKLLNLLVHLGNALHLSFAFKLLVSQIESPDFLQYILVGNLELSELETQLFVFRFSSLEALLLVLYLTRSCSLHSEFDKLVVFVLKLNLLKVYFGLQLFDSSIEHQAFFLSARASTILALS